MFRLQIILPDFEVETRIHTTKSSTCYWCVRTAVFVIHIISRAGEAKNIYDIEMHPRRRRVVARRCSFVFVLSAQYKIIRIRPV